MTESVDASTWYLDNQRAALMQPRHGSNGHNMMTFYPAEGLQKPATGQRTSYGWLLSVGVVRLYRQGLA
jgi:hypothetical protein